MNELNKYRVHLRSQTSPAWAFYQGTVTVFADDEGDAGDRAKRELKRTTFPDRSMSSWIIEKVERVAK